MAEIQYKLFNSECKEIKEDVKTKICTKCKREFPATNKFFNKQKKGKYGLRSRCKKCSKIYRKDNKNKAKKYKKEYYKINKEKINIKAKNYYEINKKRINTQHKEYCKINKDELNTKQKIYNQKKALYNTYENNNSLLLVEDIRQDSDNKNLLQIKCAYCGSWTNPTNRQIKIRIASINGTSLGENRIYCSGNCKKACPIYNQKKFPKGFRKATSREVVPELRQMCFERDSWECQKCGASIQDATLHCHHIKGYTQNKILANDIDNVITLCKSCHKEVHSQEGCKYHELRCNNE